MKEWQEKQLDLFEPEIVSLWGPWLEEVAKDIREGRLLNFSRHSNSYSNDTDGSEWVQESNVYEFVGSEF